MKKYLLAYQISGQTVGVDISSWSDVDLNGNKAFKIIRSGDTTQVVIRISVQLNFGIDLVKYAQMTICVLGLKSVTCVEPRVGLV